MHKKLSKSGLLLIILLGVFTLIPMKDADAVWHSLLWENFGGVWADWPWTIALNPWVVLPTG